MRFPRALTNGLVAALSAGALVLSVGATAQAGQKITEESFGIHSFSTDPQVPSGSIRMNCWPTWRAVQPAKGTYNWEAFDSVIRQVESWGFDDVMYVFCGTPQWAASPVSRPQDEVQGPGSTSAPKQMSYFKDYATAVVKRYGSRIDHYQAWNEITSPQFYQGTAKQMAKMTQILSKVVKQHDRTATVVSGSVQTHYDSYYKPMAPPYFRALKAKGWPVDVVAGHFYPALKGGPDARVQRIEMFKKDLKKAKKPGRVKEWDTEANFWTSVAGSPPDGPVKGRKAATFLARNYLDTWRTGLQRSYWYMWSADWQQFPGVQLRVGDPATKAYNRLGSWTIGSKFKKCTTKSNLVECSFKKGSSSFSIAFTTSGKASMKVSGTKSVCPVYGGGCVDSKGKVTVSTLPIKVG